MKNGYSQWSWIPTLTMVREHTRAEHEAIERSLKLTSDTLTLPAYQRILKRVYGFWRPVEQGLRHAVRLADSGVDLIGREKTPLFALDLRALGTAGVALCGELPFEASFPAAVGCMYVLEGATLGGQVISRHLRASLGVTPAGVGLFFHGCGERTGEMWRAFGAAATAFAVTTETQDQIVQAAVATFRTLRHRCEREDAGSPEWITPPYPRSH